MSNICGNKKIDVATDYNFVKLAIKNLFFVNKFFVSDKENFNIARIKIHHTFLSRD